MSETANPPAFPHVWEDQNEHGVRFPFVHSGMSLRDWFAGKALTETAKCSHAHGLSAVQPGSPMHPQLAAKAAYAFADAMLAARARGDSQ